MALVAAVGRRDHKADDPGLVRVAGFGDDGKRIQQADVGGQFRLGIGDPRSEALLVYFPKAVKIRVAEIAE